MEKDEGVCSSGFAFHVTLGHNVLVQYISFYQSSDNCFVVCHKGDSRFRVAQITYSIDQKELERLNISTIESRRAVLIKVTI